MIREKLIFKIFVEEPVQTCPIEALDFISAHETATGVSMGQIQQDAICGLVSRLQGNDTTNGSDLWTTFVAANTELWPLAPSTDLVASSTGYRMELISAASSGNYFNFVAGDFQPNGVTGDNVSKYFRTSTLMNAFPQNDVAHGFMISQRNDTGTTNRAGADTGGSVQTLIQSNSSAVQVLHRVNANAPASQTLGSSVQRTGLFVADRPDASTQKYFVNGVEINSQVQASTGNVATEFGFHCLLRSTSNPRFPSSDRFSFYLYGMPSLTANEHQDLYDALDWYQQNIITGGR